MTCYHIQTCLPKKQNFRHIKTSKASGWTLAQLAVAHLMHLPQGYCPNVFGVLRWECELSTTVSCFYFLHMYTTWKVDGATPMYWSIMAPYFPRLLSPWFKYVYIYIYLNLYDLYRCSQFILHTENISLCCLAKCRNISQTKA